ncbi:MAG: PhzF family phenazine biosynthesis protein [Candidatus Aminicenantaceae bacterium]
MPVEIYQVDAFTEKPFSGNPAAVCLLPEKAEESWMQNVAKEMNLSETAFLLKQKHSFHLRWFTPTVEVELCGHATLASAHILWETELLTPQEEARFDTLSGLLTACRKGEKIELNFPANPEKKVQDPPEFGEILGVTPKYIGKNKYDYLVEVQSESEVKNAKPDFPKLKQLGVRGIMITSQSSSSEYDFVSRFFAPGAGVDEDPVTGSAHCCLGPYWSQKLGKKDFVAYQASNRGGILFIHLEDGRVFIGGRAVTVMRGELLPG